MLRWLSIILLLVAPLAVHADNASVTTPAQTDSGLQQTGSTAASPQTLDVLQPAGTGPASTPLQSADASGAGAAQSTAQELQQPDSSNQAKLLVQGDGEQPHQLGDSPALGWLGYAALILLVASAVTAILWWLQRRRS